MKRIAAFITLLYIALHAVGQPMMPKYEMRAVWLTTIGGIDWPRTAATSTSSIRTQQQELCNILDRLKAANVNTVILQTRVRASVIYPSRMEPWDYILTGTAGRSPGYDPLQFAIDECHRRGMQLHAWVVTLPVGKWNSAATKQIRQRFPNNIRKIGDEGYMNPERSETADYIAGICREITDRYDVDGIHLDYIRYPETWKLTVSRDEARRNITHIVRRIHEEVKRSKPWVMVSCAPVGKFTDLSHYGSRGWNAYTKVCQDAQGWLRDGLMDALMPMMYFKGDHFYPFVYDWQQHTYGRIVAVGLGTYMLAPREGNWTLETLTREMYVARSLGLGHVHFRSKFLTDNTKGIYDFTTREFDHYPALVPAMTWAQTTPPDAPATLDVTHNADGTTQLTWSAARDNNRAPYLVYNVYASATTPVNTNDPRNLIATRVMGTTLNLRPSTLNPQPSTLNPLHYAVCAVDRFGNESQPVQDVQRPAETTTAITMGKMIENDGRTLNVPTPPANAQAEYLVIETMQGSIVAYHNCQEQIDISQLPSGVYVLKTLNSKGITYRLGGFMK